MEPSAEAQAAWPDRRRVCDMVLGRAWLQHALARASASRGLHPHGVLDRRRGECVQPHRRARRARLRDSPNRHSRHGGVADFHRQTRSDALSFRFRGGSCRFSPLQLQPRVRLPRRFRIDAHRLSRRCASACDADAELVPRLGWRSDARDGRADIRHVPCDSPPLDSPPYPQAREALGGRRRQRPRDDRRPRPSAERRGYSI